MELSGSAESSVSTPGCIPPAVTLTWLDFKCHMNNTVDLYAMEFLDLLASFGLVQHVKGAIHNHGNTLDLV